MLARPLICGSLLRVNIILQINKIIMLNFKVVNIYRIRRACKEGFIELEQRIAFIKTRKRQLVSRVVQALARII